MEMTVRNKIKELAKNLTGKEPMDSDEVQFLASLFQIELNWNNGNLTTEEYYKQLAHLEKKGYI